MLTQWLKPFFQRRFDHWLKKRMPAKNQALLTSRNIFIFPTRFGFVYLAFVLLVFLLGTNYQNNVIILLSYLLGSFFITAMLHSFYNVSGLSVAQQVSISGFAKQRLAIPITCQSTKNRYHFTFSFYNNDSVFLAALSGKANECNVPYIANTRGKHQLGRLKISSEYGFGLFTTWTQLDLNIEIMVYPAPIAVSNHSPLHVQDLAKGENNGQNLGKQQPKKSGEDFYALEPYKEGESLNHVAWKQVARGQGWLSKHYQQDEVNQVWLALADMPSADLETKLSMLSSLVVEYDAQGFTFGLTLAQQSIEPAQGAAHVSACLTALALYSQYE